MLAKHGFTAIHTQYPLPGVPGFQRLSQVSRAAPKVDPKSFRDELLFAMVCQLTGHGMLQRC